MGKGITDNFQELTESTQEYIEAAVAYHKLDIYKKFMQLAVSSVHKLVIGLILLLSLIFLSFALAFYLGHLLDNTALGYLLVGLIYAVLCVVAVLFLKPRLERLLLRKTSQKLFNDKEHIHLEE